MSEKIEGEVARCSFLRPPPAVWNAALACCYQKLWVQMVSLHPVERC